MPGQLAAGLPPQAASAAGGALLQPGTAAPATQQQQQQPQQRSARGRGKLLDYAVAIDDAKAVIDRLRRLRRGAPLHLPTEAGCLPVWEVLAGRVAQRRVWTWGAEPDPADAAASAHPVAGAEPVSVRGGVHFVSCAAGRGHSAAADAAGHVFTWGDNGRGQCGIEDGAVPVATHALPPRRTGGEGSEGRRLGKLDSLALLASSVRLPQPLLSALRAQQARREAATATAVGANAGPASTQAQPAEQGGRTAGNEAAADGAALSEERQLRIYRLSLGQAVAMVACGGGQCGVPAASFSSLPCPTRVHAFDGERLLQVAAGLRHSAVVQDTGCLVTFGHGRFGRLGLGFEPDCQPPSAVGGALRGEAVAAAACGSAHTLALTRDGRVYAFGHNGRGALGTWDGADRLSPAQVPGLRPCAAVAAGAASMALGCAGEVYIWGDCAPAGCCAAAAAAGAGPRVDSRERRHAPLAALAGLRARAIACGVEGAAVVLEEGGLVLLGGADAVPRSLRARAAIEAACARDEARAAAAAASADAAAGSGAPPPRPGRTPRGLKLDVGLGASHPVAAAPVAIVPCVIQDAHAAADTDADADADAEAAALLEGLRQAEAARGNGGAVSDAEAEAFDPEGDPPEAAACGEAHTLVLCAPSDYAPSLSEVRGAVLAVLRAYVRACCGARGDSLGLLQLDAGAASGGSVWGGGSIAAKRGPGSVWGGGSIAAGSELGLRGAGGRYRAPSTIVSFGLPRRGGYAASLVGSALGAGGGGSGLGSSGDDATQPPRPRRASAAKTVKWLTPADGDGGSSSAGDDEAAAGARPRRSGVGWGGASVAGSGGGEPPGAVAPALPDGLLRPKPQAPPEIGLHGLFLLCREIGLVDDLTEYSDVKAAFDLMLHRKLGRLGPRDAASGGGGAARPERAACGALLGSGSEQEEGDKAEGGGGTDVDAPAGLAQRIVMVPVARPGVPLAVTPPPVADGADAAAQAAGARPAPPPSPPLPPLQAGRPSAGAPPAGAAAPAAAAARAARTPPAGPSSLTETELLELLLLLLRARHPQLRREPEALLRLLASRHVLRLRGRRPDKGPPWLLRQVLSPDILGAFEFRPASSELLHAVYVHLAGRTANPSDLALSLSDLRLGLKTAALAAEAAGAPAAAGAAEAAAPPPPPPQMGLPLAKVAAFLRTAGLVPRLFALYMAQLQRRAEAARGDGGGGPVMPSLRLPMYSGSGGGGGGAEPAPPGARRRRGPRQEGEAWGSRRLSALSEEGASEGEEGQGPHARWSPASGGLRSPLLRSGSTAPSHGGSASGSAGAGRTPDSPGAGGWRSAAASPLSRRGSSRRLPGGWDLGPGQSPGDDAAPLPRRRSSSPGSAQITRQGSQGPGLGGPRHAAAAAASRRASREQASGPATGHSGLFDAALLDDAELLPSRSRRASVVLDAASDDGGGGGGGGEPRRPGASRALRLELPAAAADALQGRAAGARGSPGARPPATYQEQQAALKQAAAAAVAGAAAAAEAERLHQDTWLVFVLAELLGSFIVGPSAAQPQAASSQQPQQQQQPVWQQQQQRAPGAGGAAPASRASVDLMSLRISYPQFVEVLLLCAAARASGVLDLGLKAVPALALDAEMREHLRTVTGLVRRWRDQTLNGRAAPAAAAAAAAAAAPAGRPAGPAPSVAGTAAEAVRDCYWLYSRLDADAVYGRGAAAAAAAAAASASGPRGGDAAAAGCASARALALDLPAFKRLLEDARICGRRRRRHADGTGGAAGEGDDGVPMAECLRLFQGLADGTTPILPPGAPRGGRAAAAGGDAPRPQAMGAGQRQSTFMRGVTTQRLAQLGVDAAGAAQRLSAQERAREEEEAGRRAAGAGCGAAGRRARRVGRRASGKAARPKSSGEAGSGGEDTSSGTDDSGSGKSSGSESGDGASSAPASGDGSASSGTAGTGSGGGGSASADARVPTAASAEPAAGRPAAAPPRRARPCLTPQQFAEAVRRLAVAKFPRIANKETAWKLLVERHIAPAVQRRRNQFDACGAALATPGVAALLLAWRPELESLATAAAAFDAAAPPAPAPAPAAAAADAGADGAAEGRAARRLSFRSLFLLLQARDAIPRLLQPADVEEALRRVGFSDRAEDDLVCDLGADEFLRALALLGLSAFRGRRGAAAPRAPAAPEAQLAAFFSALGLPPLPAASAAGGGAGGGADAARAGGRDPYAVWWDMRFDGALALREDPPADGLVLLQEPALPPPGCPSAVRRLAAAAAEAHRRRDCGEALALLASARDAWGDAAGSGGDGSLSDEDASGRSSSSGSSSSSGRDSRGGSDVKRHRRAQLGPSMELFLGLAACGVHLTEGRDARAAEALRAAAPALDWLHEAGADAAAWHCAAGLVAHHLGDLRAAFEHCVRCYVLRCECASLGPSAVDTAAAAHNLGCVLGALGRPEKGLPLLDGARSGLAEALGNDHPWTRIAERNAARMRARGLRLEGWQGAAQSSRGGGSGGSEGSSSGSDGGGRSGPGERGAAGRLQRLRRGGEAGGGAVRPRRRPQEYTDGAYLGGGLYRASEELRRQYEACSADVEAHSRAASDATAAAAHAPPGAAALEMQLATAGAARAVGPALLRRCRLEDPTCAPVPKPASAEERRELRRAGGRKAGLPGLAPRKARRPPVALLDRLFDRGGGG
ncbi:hypothetical protein Rsub_11979 [Raphidocelis subcapitata]|uniref:Uncharacterized protein n=1 Tax=Raphidocelis subcapitata TaxID=307507 RepID=A0A2V0PGV3_9CHLO|nr:hypothetical protein Rsub_11979 [Raphidocelis subcapitata]|eukprot:GBF99034.1 hypothetical protein Rsub_11979 [Raphidocelis subcapitata]